MKSHQKSCPWFSIPIKERIHHSHHASSNLNPTCPTFVVLVWLQLGAVFRIPENSATAKHSASTHLPRRCRHVEIDGFTRGFHTHGGTPVGRWMVYGWETPIISWMISGCPPFMETPICCVYLMWSSSCYDVLNLGKSIPKSLRCLPLMW